MIGGFIGHPIGGVMFGAGEGATAEETVQEGSPAQVRHVGPSFIHLGKTQYERRAERLRAKERAALRALEPVDEPTPLEQLPVEFAALPYDGPPLSYLQRFGQDYAPIIDPLPLEPAAPQDAPLEEPPEEPPPDWWSDEHQRIAADWTGYLTGQTTPPGTRQWAGFLTSADEVVFPVTSWTGYLTSQPEQHS